MIAGLSTLGITVGYGTGASSTKPSTFTKLNRINSVGGINITPETIDASALEDAVEQSIAGRATTGGQFNITVNFSSETQDEWETLLGAYTAGTADVWIEIIIPNMDKAFFVVCQPPSKLPMPSFDQNSLLTMEIPMTIVDYKGLDTKVAFTA